VDVISSGTYINGDDASVSLRSYGTAVENDSPGEYDVKLSDSNGSTKEIQAQGTGNNSVKIDLGSLKSGDYSITIQGQSGKYKDALVKKIKAVDSLLEVGRTKHYKLSEDLNIENHIGLTTLTFFNDSSSTFYDALNNLLYSFGDRVDQRLANTLSGELLKKYYGESGDYEGFLESLESTDFSKYQTEDGGIALLSYGSSDPLVTAKICSVTPQYFDTNAVEAYFNAILNKTDSTPEEVAASYWGLAAIKSPVLLEIKNLLQNSNELDMKEKLYLGIALADIGDTEGASQVFKEVALPYIKKIEPLAYINVKGTRDYITDVTSIASLLAMKISSQEGTALMGYVMQNSSKELLTNLEQLVYITNCAPTINTPGGFTYVLNGKTVKVKLDKIKPYNLTLKEDDLRSIKFKEVNGDVGVTASFVGPIQDLVDNEDKLINIDRSYSNKDRITTSDIITITMHPEFLSAAPDGSYDVTDIMPAGFRFVKDMSRYDDDWYFSGQEGQKVTFTYNYERGQKNHDIIYSARAVSIGEFTADNAIFMHSTSNTFGLAGRQKITVKSN
jgi:hypothetical protein